MADDMVHLNVGGTLHTTTKSTLARYPDSMLGAMFNGTMPTTIDKNGCYFIDRDGSMFQYILNFLRSTHLALPSDFNQFELLMSEADFYQIKPLLSELNRRKSEITDVKATGESYFIEIIEVRVGSIPTMPTNNSRVKTILSGRKSVVLLLPTHFVSEDIREKLQKRNGSDYTESELNGSNIRLQLGEYLKNTGWILHDSHMSSSSGYDARCLISNLIIEQSYRDRWVLPPSVANRIPALSADRNIDESMTSIDTNHHASSHTNHQSNSH